MGKLKKYDSGTSTWVTIATGGGGSSSGGGSSFTGWDTDFAIKMSGDKTLANLTTTKIDTFDTLIIDTNSEWDAVNKYWVCQTDGTYIVNASLYWTASATGYRAIYIYVDGSLVQFHTEPGAAVATVSSITYKLSLTAGQYVEIYGRQSSGGNLDVIVGVPATEWQIWRYK